MNTNNYNTCSVNGCCNNSIALSYCVKHYKRFKKYGSTEPRPGCKGTTTERFWRFVDKKDKDACWEWLGTKSKSGYGALREDNKMLRAHRFSYMLVKGEIPEGLGILHSCDNPGCVNPNHLRAGTHKENMDEMIIKGRKALYCGESHHKAKLEEWQVREIRKDTRQNPLIAKEYGISPSLVGMIKRRETWKHVA